MANPIYTNFSLKPEFDILELDIEPEAGVRLLAQIKSTSVWVFISDDGSFEIDTITLRKEP